MKKITKKAARDAVEVGYESDDSWHNAQSNAQNKMHQIKIYLPMFKGILVRSQGHICSMPRTGLTVKVSGMTRRKCIILSTPCIIKLKNGMLTFSRKLLEGQHGLHLKMHIPLILYVGNIPEASL